MSFQDTSTSLYSRLHLGDIKRPMVGGLIVILVFIILGASISLGMFIKAHGTQFQLINNDELTTDGVLVQNNENAAAEIPQICVHVSGCVSSPGLVMLSEGARVAEAIDLSGGFTEEAAQDAINLARILVDGEQIIVPSQLDIQNQQVDNSSQVVSSVSNGKININTADKDTLMTLDGIGESTAQKIIKDRETNGPFQTVEDIKRVSGIGDKKFESLKEYISVG